LILKRRNKNMKTKDILLEKVKEFDTNKSKDILKEIMSLAEQEDYRYLMNKNNEGRKISEIRNYI
jgi:hypothetical protein